MERRFNWCRITTLPAASMLGRGTIYRWRDEHPEFRDILEQILALQASMLIQNGLKGEYNSPMAR